MVQDIDFAFRFMIVGGFSLSVLAAIVSYCVVAAEERVAAGGWKLLGRSSTKRPGKG
ncbi:hypothetical protein [Burkholderia ubonensis]|uniref:hypothetical protein n=1 Tax=Burkholderia ubonensis TaxID=101571 RepID=UPI000B126B1D|nr:hypothetical protein [Burkholderia ubonensis]